jgi:Raf kinase inhibitor-like YbhB/YbcL family protein
MAQESVPQHSGAAISIMKVRPYTDRGIVLTSDGIGVDGRIAPRHAALGDGLSPPLSWNQVDGAQAYALIVEDPDASREEPFIHWLAWNIPGHLTSLPEGVPNTPRLVTPQGMIQGLNDSGGCGWFGPKPPAGHGPHHYYFQLFAMVAPLDLSPEGTRRELVDALKGRTLAEGELIGTYETAVATRQ